MSVQRRRRGDRIRWIPRGQTYPNQMRTMMRIADRRQWTVVAIDYGAGETATVTMEEAVPRYGLDTDTIAMTFPY
jgi:hypothetical protein